MHLRLHLGFHHTVPYRFVRSTRCAGKEYKRGIAKSSQSSRGRRPADTTAGIASLRRDVVFRAGNGGVER
jgi:hypothetical protein